ncbi:MAG: YbjN domain-containing protein [Thermoanaerobaculales bacterium]
MGSLFDTIKKYFEQDGYECRQLPNHEALEMAVAGDNGSFRLVCVVDPDRTIVRFLTFVEGKVPEARRREVMEFLTRANYGLLLGNFEFDLNDGEVRFKCAMDVEGGEITHTQYQNLLYVAVSMADRYYPGLQRVVQGSADPAAAIAEVEQ